MKKISGIRFTVAALALLALGAAGAAAAPALVPPLPPTGLAAVAGNATVGLTWNPSAGALSYVVRRGVVNGGPYATIASGVLAAAYTDNTAANGTTYYYIVRALNVDGQSGNSAQVSATPNGGGAPPVQVTGLTAAPGNAQIVLSWTAIPGSTYTIERAVGAGPFTPLISGVAAATYTNLSLTNGTTYSYRVAAVNGAGAGPFSATASATPSAPPVPPAGLTATAGDATVSLIWTASPGATGYKVKRSTTSGGPYATIITLGAVTTYLDAPLANGTAYYYVVSSLSGTESANSTQASATPTAPGGGPAAPASLTATPGSGRVVLMWTASAGATSYTVKRSTTSGGPYAVVAAGLTSTLFTNTGLTDGTPYFFVVTATNGAGESGNSPQASATPQSPPLPPTGLLAVTGNHQAQLTWTASAGATSYLIRRGTTSGGPYTTVASGIVATSFLNTGLAGGVSYFYVVRAVNAGGQSGNSAEANATPPANNPPVGGPDSYSVAEDGSLNVAAPGVLVNDTDIDVPPPTLTAVIFGAGAAHGVVALNPNGSFTYTPAADYAGPDSFQYRASDGTDFSNVVTVSITVTPSNDPPVIAVIPNQSGNEDVPGTVVLSGIGPGGGADEAGQTVLVTATSSDPLIVPNPTVTGAGASRNLNFQSVLNVSGVVTITVTADDQQALNHLTVLTFQLTINPVNDVPVFTKGLDETVNENTGAHSVPGWATGLGTGGGADEAGQALDFVVSNNNNALFSVQPAINAGGTLTYTLAANQSGAAVVTVQIHDDGGVANGGINISPAQTFNITVNFVNQAPSFTKGADDSVLEDSGVRTVVGWATAISAGPASESGQLLNFIVGNDNNALFSAQPAISANGTLTYTPAANANGSATVTVQIHDNGGILNGGADTSAAQTFTVTVVPVNDVPSFVAGPNVQANENAGAQTAAAWATAISRGPADEAGQTVSFAVNNDNNALFSVQPAISPAGTLTFTGAPNANGVANVTVTILDNGGTLNGGVDTSAPIGFIITIIAVNNVPSFTAGPNQTILEDGGPQSVSGWATGISPGPANEAAQLVDFQISNDNNALFSAQPAVSPTGTLTYTPAANQFGSALVTVLIHDNGGILNGGVDASATQTFTITVTSVNDSPSFTKGSDLTVNQNAGPQTASGWATALSAGPANETGQALNFIVGNDNNALFSVQPAVSPAGVLTFTPALDASGFAMVSVQIQDNGGVLNGGVDTSAAQTFLITVSFVNQAPSFTKGPDVGVGENTGAHVSNPWATAISPGPANEAGQVLNFIVGNDNNALFSVQPAVSPAGVLTFTPALNQLGSATVTVTLHDDGGILNGGTDTSAPQTFTINVTFINQTPSFVKGGDQTVAEDSGAHSIPSWASNISAGPPNESGQLVDFLVTNNNNGLFTAGGQPAVTPAGTLTYTSAPNANGTATVSVRIHDDGGIANGAVDTSAPQTFVITVTPVNDAPVAAADSFNANQDSPLNVAAPGVLGNDSDVDNDPLQALLVTTTAFGSLSLNVDGSFSYTPNGGFVGDDSFTYRANDGLLNSNTVTVTIHVLSVIPAPPAGLAGKVINLSPPEAALWHLDGNGNDASPTGMNLSLVGSAGFAPGRFGQALDLDGTGAGYAQASMTYDFFAGRNYTIQAWVNYNTTSGEQVLVENFTGPGGPGWTLTKLSTDQFQFFVGGGITLTSPPQTIAPGVWHHVVLVKSGFEYRLFYDSVKIASGINPNDVTPSGRVITVGRRDPSGGQLFGTNGLIDEVAIWYNTDVAALSDQAVSDLYDGGTGIAVGGILPGIDLSWTASPGATSYNIYRSVGGGAFSVMGNVAGTTFRAGHFYNTGRPYYVTALNAGGESAPSTTLSFRTVPDGAGVFATSGNGKVDLNWSISHFADQIPVSYEIRRWTAGDPNYVVIATVADPGNVYTDSTVTNGIVYYYQITGVDSFSARGPDGRQAVGQPVNPSPVGVNDNYVVNEDTPLVVSAAAGVLANDSDPDLEPIFAILDTPASQALSFSFNSDGSFSYTPNPNFNGTDTFKYYANDGTSNSNLVTVIITVNPVNDPPVANNDSYFGVQENALFSVGSPGVLTNDSDPDSDPITAVLVSGPSHASAFTLNADGSFSYTPAFGYFGPDSFTYQARDGSLALSNIATVNLMVNPVNDAVLNNDSYLTDEDTPLIVNAASGVLANDFDPDGETMSAFIVSFPSKGSVTLNADGSFTYSPFSDQNGSDSFTYQIWDGDSFSIGTATVTININPINDAPVIFTPGTVTVNQDTALPFNGNVSIADVDAGAATVAVTITASNGTFTLNGISGLSFSSGDGVDDAFMAFSGPLTTINSHLDGMTFQPSPGFSGQASLLIQVNDLGNTGFNGFMTDSKTITINVIPNPPTGLVVRGVNATTQSLVGYWELNNNGLDGSLNGRDLNISGGAFGGGLFNNALSMNGAATTFAQQPGSDPIFDLSSNSDFTIQVWVNFASLAGSQVLIEKYNGTAGWTLSKTATNDLRFQTVGSVDMTVPAASVLTTTNTWYQIVIRRLGFRYRFVVNGAQIGSGPVVNSSMIQPSGAQLTVGRRASGGQGVNGRIDEAAIWLRGLSGKEVDELYGHFGAIPGGGGFRIGDLSNQRHIRLNWTSSAASFNVLRGSSSGSEGNIALGVAGNTYQDFGLPSEQQFFYQVTALGGGSTESLRSNEASGRQVDNPPGSLIATPGSTQLRLDWSAPPGGGTVNNYRLRMWTTGFVDYTDELFSNATFTTTKTGLTNGQPYYFQISTVGPSGESPFSPNPQLQATPGFMPGAPVLTATPGGSRVGLSWTPVGGATGYTVRFGPTSGGNYTNNVFIPGNQTETSIVVTESLVWYFVVSAQSADGIQGPNSNEVTTVPQGFQGPIVSTNPSNGQSNVPLASNFVYSFSQPMDHPSTEGAILAGKTPGPPQVTWTPFWSPDSRTLTLVLVGTAPGDLLMEGATYTLTLGTGARTQSGVNVDLPVTSRFTTRLDATPPQIVSMTTNGGQDPRTQTLTGPVSSITVTFNEPMNTADQNGQGGNPAQLQLRSTGVDFQAQVGQPSNGVSLVWTNNTTLVATFALPLPEYNIYRLSFDSLNDLAGNWSNSDDFAMVIARSTPDSTSPVVAGMLPKPGSTGVPRDAGIFISFSEPLSKESLAAITITENGGAPTTPFEMDFNEDPPGLFVGPSRAWPVGTVIGVSFGVGAADTSGNPLTPVAFSFTTALSGGADLAAPVLDQPYSSFQASTNSASPVLNSDSSGFLLFKNSSSNLREYLNRSTFSVSDVSITEFATGIPVKGYILELDDNGNIGGFRINWNGWYALNGDTVYELRLNSSLKNSRGVGVVPVSYYFRTPSSGGNGVPSFQNQPETRLQSYPTGPTTMAIEAELRADVQDSGPGELQTVTVQDLGDTDFSVSDNSGGPTSYYNFNYRSNGTPETTLTSTGPHVLQYTATDFAGHSVSVRSNAYVFPLSSIPTLSGPSGSIATSFPTYTWSTAGADVQGIVLHVIDQNADLDVFSVILDRDAVSFTQPADQPLSPATTYSWAIEIVNWENGILGGDYGRAFTLQSFSVTGSVLPPARLAATGGYGEVELNWRGTVGGSVGFNIYRSAVNNTSYSLLTTVSGDQTSYTDSAVTNGTTYFYKITTMGASESGDSNEVSATPIATPSNPVLTLTELNGQVNVGWTAVAGAPGYTVWRRDPFSSFSAVGATTGTSLLDSPTVNGTAYTYYVSTVNALGQTRTSSQVGITPLAPPSGLLATPIGANVFLTWPTVAGASNYSVFRSTTSGVYGAPLVTQAASSFLDATIPGGLQHFYVVTAQVPVGTTGRSPEATATIVAVPGVPSGLLATAGNQQVDLSWTSVPGATSYSVKRASGASPGSFARIATVATTSFTDLGLPSGQQYWYTVSALSGGGESADATAQTATPTGPAIRVTDLTAMGGNTVVQLNWTHVQNAGNGYNVKRGTAPGGPYTTISSNFNPGVGQGQIATFTDNGRTNGLPYFYVLTSVNGFGESANSNEAAATPAPAPGAPVLTATPGNQQVQLSWTSAAGATSYEIYRIQNGSGPYPSFFYVGNQAGLSYTDFGVLNGTPYNYVVAAVASPINKTPSNEVSATPFVPPNPTVLSTSPGNGQPNVSIATHYVVTFSEAMNWATVNNSTVTISPAHVNPIQFFPGVPNSTSVTLVFDTVNPAGVFTNDLLLEGQTHTVTIGTGCQAQSSGLGLLSPVARTFTTQADYTPPQVTSIVANPGNLDIHTTSLPGTVNQFVVQFNEPMNTSTGGFNHASIRIRDQNSDQSWEADVAGFSNPPGNTLIWNTSSKITLTLGSALPANAVLDFDLQGFNDVAGNGYWEVQTDIAIVTKRNPADSTPPTMVGSVPFDTETIVARNITIFAATSEPLSPDCVNFVTVQENGAAATTPFVVRFESSPTGLTISPKRAWPANTDITVNLGAGIKDTSGNPMSATSFTFHTANASGADAAPIEFDQPYSPFKDSMTEISPNNTFGGGGAMLFMFRNSSSGDRAQLNEVTLAPENFNVLEAATGLPVKGLRFESHEDKTEMVISGGRAALNLNPSTTYQVKVNSTFRSMTGVVSVPAAYTFTTGLSSGGTYRPFPDTIDLEYQAFTSPTPTSVRISTQLRTQNGINSVLTIGATDSPDAGFSVTQSSSPTAVQNFNFDYDQTNGNIATPGDHVATFTFSDGIAAHNCQILKRSYLFSAFPTVSSPPASSSNATPTYTWSAPFANADAQFIFITDTATDTDVYFALVSNNATTCTQPSDYPLPPGNYKVSCVAVKFERGGGFIGIGSAFVTRLFTVTP